MKPAETMSADAFRALTRRNKLGGEEPKKARAKNVTMWAHELERDRQLARKGGERCPPCCEEGRRLYHALTEALDALRAHREAHERGEL